ncbi:MAG: endo alpha-1,4 polygalactosaminidase [Solirubrobacterales bacterium]
MEKLPLPQSLPRVPATLALLALACLGGLSLSPADAGAKPARSAFAACARHGEGHRPRWHPRPTTAPWQWQLQGSIDKTIPACVYEVDGFETSARTVAALHRRHVKAICYLDVGSWESYRPDRAEFPRSVIGAKYEGFPDERWLDVSRFHRFARPLKQRIAMCARKGFDAVEPDNVQGWEAENHTGFRITRSDQLRFNRWIARQVHRRGMPVALKNDGRQADRLVHAFDFAIVEECFQYHECGYYRTFVRHDKAVFEAEYELKPRQYCRTAAALRFSAIRKSYDLFARPWRPCFPA